VGDKGFLEWMQSTQVRAFILALNWSQRPQSFDGEDRLPLGFARASGAGSHWFAIHQHRADTTASFTTADLGACQLQP